MWLHPKQPAPRAEGYRVPTSMRLQPPRPGPTPAGQAVVPAWGDVMTQSPNHRDFDYRPERGLWGEEVDPSLLDSKRRSRGQRTKSAKDTKDGGYASRHQSRKSSPRSQQHGSPEAGDNGSLFEFEDIERTRSAGRGTRDTRKPNRGQRDNFTTDDGDDDDDARSTRSQGTEASWHDQRLAARQLAAQQAEIAKLRAALAARTPERGRGEGTNGGDPYYDHDDGTSYGSYSNNRGTRNATVDAAAAASAASAASIGMGRPNANNQRDAFDGYSPSGSDRRDGDVYGGQSIDSDSRGRRRTAPNDQFIGGEGKFASSHQEQDVAAGMPTRPASFQGSNRLLPRPAKSPPASGHHNFERDLNPSMRQDAAGNARTQARPQHGRGRDPHGGARNWEGNVNVNGYGGHWDRGRWVHLIYVQRALELERAKRRGQWQPGAGRGGRGGRTGRAAQSVYPSRDQEPAGRPTRSPNSASGYMASPRGTNKDSQAFGARGIGGGGGPKLNDPKLKVAARQLKSILERARRFGMRVQVLEAELMAAMKAGVPPDYPVVEEAKGMIHHLREMRRPTDMDTRYSGSDEFITY